jgi:hypothetical protein
MERQEDVDVPEELELNEETIADLDVDDATAGDVAGASVGAAGARIPSGCCGYTAGG